MFSLFLIVQNTNRATSLFSIRRLFHWILWHRAQLNVKCRLLECLWINLLYSGNWRGPLEVIKQLAAHYGWEPSVTTPTSQCCLAPLPIIIMCNTDIWARPPPVTHLTQVEGLYSLYLLLYTCTPYHAASHPCTAVQNNTDILSVCLSISVKCIICLFMLFR